MSRDTPGVTNGEKGSERLHRRYRGMTPPGYDDEWAVQTIGQGFTVQGVDTVECAATGEPFDSAEPHVVVQVRRVRENEADVETLHVRDADALEAWLDG